jgi:hypothetical protein
MGTFSVRMGSLAGVSGSWSLQGGAIDEVDAVELYDTKSLRDAGGINYECPPGTVVFGNMHAAGGIWALRFYPDNQNVILNTNPPINFKGLPNGFHITSCTVRFNGHTSYVSGGSPNSLVSFEIFRDGGFIPIHTDTNNNYNGANDSSYDIQANDSSVSTLNAFLNQIEVRWTVVANHVTDFGCGSINYVDLFVTVLRIILTGSFDILIYSWTIDTPLVPHRPGATVRITSPVGQLDLSTLDGSIVYVDENGNIVTNPVINNITQTTNEWEFTIPDLPELFEKPCTPVAATVATLIGILSADLASTLPVYQARLIVLLAIGNPSAEERAEIITLTALLSIMDSLIFISDGLLLIPDIVLIADISGTQFVAKCIVFLNTPYDDVTYQAIGDEIVDLLEELCIVAEVGLFVTPNPDPGTQFTGSVKLGNLIILLENASGIYRIVPNKTNDTLYINSNSVSETTDIKMPNPFAKGGYIGG